MKVCKFGGTSLADARQIKKVCDIVLSDPERRLVVVSAPGKRFSEDTKVTDMLIACSNVFLSGGDYESELAGITARYAEIAGELGVPEIMELIEIDLRARLMKGLDAERLTDIMKAAGEDNCAKLVAAYLVKRGAEARYINPGEAGMLLSDEFGNAVVLPESYNKLSSLANISGIGVFPGFFGFSKCGDVVTFPRGGSDISGAILAAAIKAEVYENFTDVDYVYSVNPKLVNGPNPIKHITYREMRELSYAGFNVYQEEALLPVFKAGVPVNIRNVNNPSCPGTMITQTRERESESVVGVASDDGFCFIYINKYLMNREIGFARRVLSIIEDEKLSFEHMPSGIDDLSIIIKEKFIAPGQMERILERIMSELSPERVYAERNLSLIMVVGEGMAHQVGIASRATAALAKAGVNIEMISQGSSEVSMIFATAGRDCNTAVKALYSEFFKA